MVAAGADTLSKDFGKEKLMPLFQLSLILMSSVTRFVNAKYLIRTQHKTRIVFVTACIVVSFFIIALCVFESDIEAMFYVSLLASIVVGIGIALGESTNLGFLKTFPGETIGFYGSGTGMAGITGSLIFIALKPIGLSDGAIYMIAIPTAIPYFLSFLWLNKQKKLYPYIPDASETAQPEDLSSVSPSQAPKNNNALENQSNLDLNN